MTYLHDSDWSKAHPAWQKATDLVGVLETSLFAFENDSVNVPLQQRGIEVSLSVAIQMGLELRDMCERLEDEKRASAQVSELKPSKRVTEGGA